MLRKSVEELDKILSTIQAVESQFEIDRAADVQRDDCILQEKISLLMNLKMLRTLGFKVKDYDIPGVEKKAIRYEYVGELMYDVFGASNSLYEQVAEATGWQKICMPFEWREDVEGAYGEGAFLPVEVEDPEWKAFNNACALPVVAQNMIRHRLFELFSAGAELYGVTFYQNSRIIDFLRYCDTHHEASASPICRSIYRLLGTGICPCARITGIDGIRNYIGKQKDYWAVIFVSFCYPDAGEYLTDDSCYSSSRALKLFLLHEYLNLAEEAFHFSSVQEVVA